jgi:hypothetical protein
MVCLSCKKGSELREFEHKHLGVYGEKEENIMKDHAISPQEARERNRQDLKIYLKNNMAAIESTINYQIRQWQDPMGGTVYIDISSPFSDSDVREIILPELEPFLQTRYEIDDCRSGEFVLVLHLRSYDSFQDEP